jgi:cytochrome c551/c552
VEPVTDITGTTAIVHGVLDPKAASPEALVAYDFFYGGEDSTCDEPSAQQAPQPPGVASGAKGEPVEVSLSGLIPHTEYSVCMGARNRGEAFGLGELSAPVKFKTTSLPPDVVSESVSERWDTAVLIEARINNEAEPTECFFQYGEASVSEHEVSCGGIGGYGEQTLSAKVEGLTAGHTYHWRTVAKNEAGTSHGKEESFTTASAVEPPELSLATLTWSPGIGVPVTAPANASSSEPKALFDWGACPTAGYCTGVGSYKEENGNGEALAATRINGSWSRAVEIALPAGAASSGQEAGFGFGVPSVACTEPGDCVAVGHYFKEGGSEAAMAASETDGAWGAASEIKLPENAASDPEALLASVACPAAGECVARGGYTNEDGEREAMVADETDGSWSPASAVESPADAEGGSGSYSGLVACSATGACVEIGEYRDGSTKTREAMVVTEVGGSWTRAQQLALPANAGSKPESVLRSVVCVPSGPCVAVGSYTNQSGGREALVAEETGGVWGPASQIVAPPNVAANPEIGFGFAPFSIACAASGSCVLTAQYTDYSGDREALVAEETSGVWGPASEIAVPANAASDPDTVLYPACPASGECALVGAYTDAEGDREALVADGAGGSRGQVSEVLPAGDAAGNPETQIGEVQCPVVGSCVAFGEYTSHAGAARDMEVTGMAPPENTVAPIVGGTATVGQALTCSQGTWTAGPTSYAYRWLRDGVAIGGAESNTYTVTAADEGHTISCEVTATNGIGSKKAASANGRAVREEARERREEEALATAKREQEEETAAKRKQEEEATATAKRKREEEAKSAATGSVRLAGSVVAVRSDGKGSVELTCTGTATCTGRVTLTVGHKGKQRGKAKTETIGTVAFSIPEGKTGVLTITLTTAGRALLKAAHGKLAASLTITKSSPVPTSTERESVELVQKQAAKPKKKQKG